MLRTIKRNSIIALGFIFFVLSFCQTAEAKWRSADPNCLAINAPNISDDPEAFFEWWGGCIDDVEEPRNSSPPPVTCDHLDGRRITDASGRCWRIVCTSAFEWRLVPCKIMASVRPGIASLFVTTSGFTPTVTTSTGRKREIRVKPSQVKLVYLVRAALSGAKLPSEDLLRVRPDYWTSLKGGPIRVTGTFTRN